MVDSMPGSIAQVRLRTGSCFPTLATRPQGWGTQRYSLSLCTDFQHYAEPCFARHHAVVGFGCFLQRVNLVHGFDAGEGAKFQRVFRIHAGAGGPAGYGAAAEEQREGADDDGAVGRADEDEFAGGGEAVDDPFERFGAGDGGEDDVGTADLLEFFGRVLRGGVDVDVSAQLLGKCAFVLSAGDGDGTIACLGGVLDGEVAKSADAEDGDGVAGAGSGVAQGVEGGDAGAEQRSSVGIVEFGRHEGDGVGGGEDIVGISAVVVDAADGLVFAKHEVTATTGRAVVERAPVPAEAFSLSWFIERVLM